MPRSLFPILLALLLSACATAPKRDDSLYRALGERAGIAKVVDSTLLWVLADARINELFTATDPAQLAPLLVDQICEQCVQGDVKASELFHALVSTLYEAREHLDFSQVKPRGKWGSPTAKAFPVSLKNSFRSAIAQGHSPNKR